MGITGLLPLLRSVTDRVHIDSLSGQTVAIDAYSWLHKGAYGCSADLFHGRPTRFFIDFCVARLRFLLSHNIKAILVFDGDALPAKKSKEQERARNRADARTKAEELISQGKLEEASTFYTKAVDVTPEMAHQLVQYLKKLFPADRVQCLVAPYEADAQMAFMEQQGLVQAVISEDSDLLLFGVQRLCVKLDGRTGYFEEIRAERIQFSRNIDIRGCTLKRVRQMCILSGCDYLDSVNGMGLKTANRYLTKYHTPERIIQVLRAEGRKVPEGYEEAFIKAELVFCHQRVYNPKSRKLEHLVAIDENTFPFSDTFFLGPPISDDLARSIAECVVHPTSHEPFSPPLKDKEPENKPREKIVVSPYLNGDKRITMKRGVEYSAYFPNAKSTHTAYKKQTTIRDFFQ